MFFLVFFSLHANGVLTVLFLEFFQLSRLGLLHGLRSHQPCIHPSRLLEQASMVASFDDPTAVHHDNLMGVLDRAETVGDGDDCSTVRGLVESFLDESLGRDVERARRLVEEEDGWIADDGSGDGDTLFLSTAEKGRSFAYLGRVPLAESLDKVVGVGYLACILDAFESGRVVFTLPSRVDEPVGDVVKDRPAE